MWLPRRGESGGAKDEIMKTRKGNREGTDGRTDGIERRQPRQALRTEGGEAWHWTRPGRAVVVARGVRLSGTCTPLAGHGGEGREQTGERKTMICSPISSRTHAHSPFSSSRLMLFLNDLADRWMLNLPLLLKLK